MTARGLAPLLRDIRACTLCAPQLPQPPRPVLQAHRAARILIAGQAPGRKVDRSGIPFDDASGDRLRLWMGVDRETFHDPTLIAIVPMGFCYPGTGASGDLPPRPECATAWRDRVLAGLPNIRLTLAIGQYAQAWHLEHGAGATVTGTVRAWRDHWPAMLPLPHPSPRNNVWLRRNPWFDEEVIPALRAQVRKLIELP
ncbi:uracil-DNA glycosylase family protein [Variovorax sp. YR216]|uniref:uracil-DNA glycosylase family protein n=1 Tax=Variovorax sp. YR216 TaxID=1882828 RepID=UPI0008970DAB|nr:uracil-DNA glycosylase family protein [Variovorax sp. YR216]SEB09118.1 Uracil-DNA glycosylase [Variovorax sp. YR216]